MAALLLGRSVGESVEKKLALPNQEEIYFIQQLRDRISVLPRLNDTPGNSDAENTWTRSRIQLRKLLMKNDPRAFLTWDIIREAMFVQNPSYILDELNGLRNSAGWNNRWEHAIKESAIGLPLPSDAYPLSSGNLIHHAFSLCQFEEKTGKPIEDLKLILEFGGGYGSMCRLVHNLGFKGKYIIFDLPEYSALQKFFLQMNHIEVCDNKFKNEFPNSVLCISEMADLESLLGKERINLFIATWSISETSESFRKNLLSLVSECDNYLIAYQDVFGEVDNIEFFSKWAANHSEITWNNWKIPHLPGNNYLIGSRPAQLPGRD